MYPFPSINQFRNVVQHVRRQAAFLGLDEQGARRTNVLPQCLRGLQQHSMYFRCT